MTSPELDVLYGKLLRLYEIELGRVLTELELSAVAEAVGENAPGDPSLATGVAQLIDLCWRESCPRCSCPFRGDALKRQSISATYSKIFLVYSPRQIGVIAASRSWRCSSESDSLFMSRERQA